MVARQDRLCRRPEGPTKPKNLARGLDVEVESPSSTAGRTETATVMSRTPD